MKDYNPQENIVVLDGKSRDPLRIPAMMTCLWLGGAGAVERKAEATIGWLLSQERRKGWLERFQHNPLKWSL